MQKSIRSYAVTTAPWASAPYLSSEDEEALYRRWRDEHDPAALNKLVMSHMRMVAKLARRFRHYGLAFDDLMQEGAIGLMQAAERFDPAHGARFSTYAKWWVQAALYNYVVRNSSIVRPGATSKHVTLFFRLAGLKARAGYDRRLSDEERAQLAREMDTSLEVVSAVEARVDGADVPLNAQASADSKTEILDFFEDEGPTPEEIVSDSEETSNRSHSLADAMLKLDARERMVIQQRYLGESGVTLESLGRQLGVSKERVRQLERRAFRKLAANMPSGAA